MVNMHKAMHYNKLNMPVKKVSYAYVFYEFSTWLIKENTQILWRKRE